MLDADRGCFGCPGRYGSPHDDVSVLDHEQCVKMTDEHYGHFARDSRDHAIALLNRAATPDSRLAREVQLFDRVTHGGC